MDETEYGDTNDAHEIRPRAGTMAIIPSAKPAMYETMPTDQQIALTEAICRRLKKEKWGSVNYIARIKVFPDVDTAINIPLHPCNNPNFLPNTQPLQLGFIPNTPKPMVEKILGVTYHWLGTLVVYLKSRTITLSFPYSRCRCPIIGISDVSTTPGGPIDCAHFGIAHIHSSLLSHEHEKHKCVCEDGMSGTEYPCYKVYDHKRDKGFIFYVLIPEGMIILTTHGKCGDAGIYGHIKSHTEIGPVL